MKADEFSMFGRWLLDKAPGVGNNREEDRPSFGPTKQAAASLTAPRQEGDEQAGMPPDPTRQSPTPGRAVAPAHPPSGRDREVIENERIPEGVDYDAKAAKQIIGRLVKQGFSPEFAAGQAANMLVESGMNPTSINKDEGAFGLFQWRNDRVFDMYNLADRQGKNVNDINTQLDYLLAEFAGSERVNLNRMFKDDPQAPQDYARLTDDYIVRSNGKTREMRARLGGQIYRDFFGGEMEGDDIAAPTVPESQTAGGMSEADQQAFMDYYINERGRSPEETQALMDAILEGDIPPDAAEQVVADMEAKAPGAGSEGGAPTPQETLASQGDAGVQVDSPTAGESAAPTPNSVNTGVPEDYAPGEARGGLEGFFDIFRGRPGEGAQSKRMRRKSMWLNAAEGLGMLSRGTKPDFTTAATLAEDERQRAFKRKSVRTREDRLQDQLELDTLKHLHEKAKYQDIIEDEEKLRQSTVEFFENRGLTEYAKMAKTNPEEAMDAWEVELENEPDVGFSLTPEALKTHRERAKELGLDGAANGLEEGNSPEVQEAAYLKVLEEEAERAAETGDTRARNNFLEEADELIDSLPLSPEDEKYAKGQARIYAQDPEASAMTSFGEMIAGLRDEAYNNPRMNSYRDVEEAQRAEFKKVVTSGLYPTARATMGYATNKEYDPTYLKAQVFDPISKILRSFPGGEQVAETFLGVSNMDTYTNSFIDAMKRYNLPSMIQDYAGSITERELDEFLKILADGKMTRTEMLALSQMWLRRQDAVMAAQAEVEKYRENTPLHERTATELQAARERGRNSVTVFNRAYSEQDFADMMFEQVKTYAKDKNLVNDDMSEERKNEIYHSIKYENLPNEMKGEVVFYNNELVPLWKEEFGDEFDTTLETASEETRKRAEEELGIQQ